MRPLKLSIFGTLALAATLGGGCTKVTASGDDFPTTPGHTNPTPNNPTPNNPTPTPTHALKYAGIYEANAPLDFTQNGVLPGLASPALAALTQVDTNPGKAIVDFAYAAGVDIPGGSTGRSLIGSFLDGQLNNRMPQDVKDVLAAVANIADITKTSVLKNRMTIHTPQANGTVAVELQIAGASFEFLNLETGDNVQVEATTSSANATAAKTSLTAKLTPRANNQIADADLSFSGGTLSIPIGDFLLSAVVPVMFPARYQGSTLKDSLHAVMAQTCSDLGADVDDFVYQTFGLSPGYQLGEQMCLVAVDLAALQITDKLRALKIDGVKISNGRAVLFDTSDSKPTADKQSDRIAEGTWTWDFSGVDVPSTLKGDRIGNAN